MLLLQSFFFFSSRRRHTRLQGDWSSDVCSSDLFSSIRMTPALRLGGQSGRSSATGRGRSLKWAYITAMVDSPRNGSRPVNISYATTPSEYWSDAPVTSRVAHCSGLMYVGVPTVTPVIVSPSA